MAVLLRYLGYLSSHIFRGWKKMSPNLGLKQYKSEKILKKFSTPPSSRSPRGHMISPLYRAAHEE